MTRASESIDRGEFGTEGSPALLVVVGASLRAEREDRVIAHALRDAANERFHGPPGGGALVCCDVWYLGHDALQGLATISVGPPENNALTARLADAIPAAFAIDGRVLVQFDVRGRERVACVWGTSREETAHAADVFVDRFLAQFLANLA